MIETINNVLRVVGECKDDNDEDRNMWKFRTKVKGPKLFGRRRRKRRNRAIPKANLSSRLLLAVKG